MAARCPHAPVTATTLSWCPSSKVHRPHSAATCGAGRLVAHHDARASAHCQAGRKRRAMSEEQVMEVDVLVVGAGISGIGTAWHLQTYCPDRSYLILES